ncbi:MAG: hypothetical protein TREMPRED_003620 [Tremellales sp. Tagirdzhanova-0007]|nr:MAG: hypothetical protein TREMPRED_003620 [Tremellales sp. Tagirdzhanova-0007]
MPCRPAISPRLVLRQYATSQLPARPAPAALNRRPSTRPSPPALKPYPPLLKSSSLPSHRYSPPDRIYTQRKAFLYAYYAHLLKRSHLVLLFAHDNLSVPDTNRLRAALKKVPVPSPSTSTILHTRSDKDVHGVQEEEGQGALLTVTRTGVFAALAKTIDNSISLAPFLTGQTALLTCPSLSPKYLSALLRTMNRSLTTSKRPESREKVVKQPYMTLVAGVLGGNRLVGAEEVVKVSKLPELAVLQAQVVGLLEGSGRNLVNILAQAGGGGLVRTLEGLQKNLGEEVG